MAPMYSWQKFLPSGLKTDHIRVDQNKIMIHCRSKEMEATCPHCDTTSQQVHSTYSRRPCDLPAHGYTVEMTLLARRFRCSNACCKASTFAERFPPSVLQPYARRTSRLQDLVRHLGYALGGRPAQALASRLQFPVKKDTFLRSIRKAVVPESPKLRVIGIDDWAWRKGHRYGTLICDLEQRQVVDLLPDREPATVEDWLRKHPDIEVVARDRNGGYATAISRALPKAVQVADRWHLLANVSEAFLTALRKKMPDIREAIGAKTLDTQMLTAAEKLQYEGYLRRQQTNKTVRELSDKGTSIKRIVRLTGLSRGLVRQIVRGEREDVFRIRENSLTPWLPQLEKEWRNGCQNGAELWRRLRSSGFKGSRRVVGEWATRKRRSEVAEPAGPTKTPPVRQLAKLLTVGRDHLGKSDALKVAQIETALPELVTARNLVTRFTNMVRNSSASELATWLDEAKDSLIASFVNGLQSDIAAVEAALREPWSNGQTEGQINRLKTLKRQMYGRANIDLLKARLVVSA